MEFLFDNNILYGDIDPNDYSYIWANLNKAFDSEIGDIFNNEDNGYYYTELINTFNFGKITDQIIINSIAVCVERNNGKFVDYFKNKFKGIDAIFDKAKELPEPFQFYKDSGITVKDKYLKKYNMYLNDVY